MSENKEKMSGEDRQKGVYRKLELMKAAVGDVNFSSDSDSDSCASERPSSPVAWKDADGNRESEEFIQSNSKSRFSYIGCLFGTVLWIIALSCFGLFGYYMSDFVIFAQRSSASVGALTYEKHAEAVRKALFKNGVLEESLLKDPKSPQAAALQWLVQDTMKSSTKANDPHMVQRYSLAVMYYSTNGEDWTNSEGWMTNEGYCSWYGVSCLDFARHGNGRIFELNLSGNQLKGNLPAELNGLQDLFFLYLQDNELEGTIPDNLGGWTGLRMISVAHNKLYGSIPVSLVTTTPDLRILNAGHNGLTGTIPPEIGDATNLREVHLEFNGLHGHLPDSLRDLDRLQILHLAGNQLGGSLPSGIYEMRKLKTLYLHDNSLTGHLSNDFAMLSHLELLTLNHNQFVGTVPNVFNTMRRLQEVRLHANTLSGTMPPSVCAL